MTSNVTLGSGEGVGRATGKVIVLGEHAVVYGAPGLAAGIERGVTARLTLTEGAGTRLLLGDRDVSPNREGDDLSRAFDALLQSAPLPERLVHQGSAGTGFTVAVTTEIAPGGGLGCSAAIGVAIARAIECLAEETSDPRALGRATAWEGVFHGNPSGIDTAAAFSGGFLRFVRGEGAFPLESPRPLHFAVGYSGTSASTKEMVASVARIRERRPDQIAKFLEAVTSLVRNAELAIRAGDISGLGGLLDLNQMLLAGLMLSTEAIETMRHIAKDSGSLGTKLTGSGGGGSVIALTEDAEGAERTVTAWRERGFDGFATLVRARKATS